MSRPIIFPEQTNTIQPPAGELHYECGSLPVHFSTDHGFPQIISKWELTEAELAEVARTGCIYLTLISYDQVPVYVSPESPFEE